jgi:uncharacterized protein YgiM (DUF1202 family)
VLFLLVGCEAEQSKLAGRAKIAEEKKAASVRLAAVKKLTDQAVLAKIAVEDMAADVRLAAVEKLTDQAVLAKIAVEDMAASVRYAAVEKLTDQALLAEVALIGKDATVGHAAVEKLTDQALLAKIATEEKPRSLRRVAVEKLTDQAVKPSDQEPTEPVTAEAPPEAEVKEKPPVEVAKVEPAPVEAGLATPEPEAEVSDVAKPLPSVKAESWYVLLRRMNIRQDPSVSSKITRKLNKNEEFQIIEEAPGNNLRNAWYLIRTRSGFTGWLCGIFDGNVKYKELSQLDLLAPR